MAERPPTGADSPAVPGRMATSGRLALGGAGLLALGSAWIIGNGVAGPLYVLAYALAALPGLPIGFALFGARSDVLRRRSCSCCCRSG